MPDPAVTTTPAGSPLAAVQLAAVAGYIVVQLLIVLYASHRYLLLWRWWRTRDRGVPPPPPVAGGPTLPVVTVQLPVYNESAVVARLIRAAAALDYAAGRLEIQVLDDSTDATRTIAAAEVARQRARGVDIVHLHRERREGFKAGALAAGLARARGELVAVFDADFVPAPDFLLRLVPRFAEPAVGMVQARWTHLNRDRSILTAAQAALLDAHFLIEHPARMRAGLFFNFNGTAGIWRRACIEDAGGWAHDTLTEDLDLSYRAQLRGWRFVFDASVAAPAELPGDIEGFTSQQRRWTRGAIQTARKLLPAIWRAPLPGRVKLEAFLHLTGNVAYALLLVLGILLLPVLMAPSSLPPAVAWGIQLAVMVLGVTPVGLFLAVGLRAAGAGAARVARDLPAALVLGSGLSANNSWAVLTGLGPRLGDWERTPKTGDTGAALPRPARHGSGSRLRGRAELLLAAWFAGVGAYAWGAGHAGAVPFAALLVAGFASVGLASLRASLVRATPGPGRAEAAGASAPASGG